MLQVDPNFFELDDDLFKISTCCHDIPHFDMDFPCVLCIISTNETLNIMSEISLTIWDNGKMIILTWQIAACLLKVYTTN